jgi:hypothetical protein
MGQSPGGVFGLREQTWNEQGWNNEANAASRRRPAKVGVQLVVISLEHRELGFVRRRTMAGLSPNSIALLFLLSS